MNLREMHSSWLLVIFGRFRFRRLVELGCSRAPILSATGRSVVVVGLARRTAHQARAYNLTVADIHTYYVRAGATPVLVHNADGDPLPTREQGRNKPLTNKQAKDLAEYLGYQRTNFRVKGQPVFSDGKTYISQDIGNGDGSHNGGTWKIADTLRKLESKDTRAATADALLTKIGC